jgi:uncharacterized protein YbjT (DUF2867 family)
MTMAQHVFVAGATGYLGHRLIPELIRRGHTVRGLARSGSEHKLSAGCGAVIGSALDRSTFGASVAPADTYVQLVGVPHPSPAKAAQFRAVDLLSVRESVAAAVAANVRHFVYVSVAHPAPVMKAYTASRAEAEALIRKSGLAATFVRPWYVLGPGHRWAYTLLPAYWLLERLPVTRETALRLGLVTLPQMAAALVRAVEWPADGIRIMDVPAIRSAA